MPPVVTAQARRRPRPIILLMGLAGLALGLAPALAAWPPALVWNATASAPVGLYLCSHPGSIAVGDLVAVTPPKPLADWLSTRGAAPHGVLLVKRVAALPPSRLCGTHGQVSVDGRQVAVAASHDRMGRSLPVLGGCQRLQPGQVLLLNEAVGSLDGRYFGPLASSQIVGRVRPLWTVRERGRGG